MAHKERIGLDDAHAAQFDARVAYKIYLCGDGTFMLPFWLELGDFLVHVAVSSALDTSSIDRWRSDQRSGDEADVIASLAIGGDGRHVASG